MYANLSEKSSTMVRKSEERNVDGFQTRWLRQQNQPILYFPLLGRAGL